MNLYVLPQILSSLAAASFGFLLGIGALHTAILIPYFTPHNNVTIEKSFTLSENERTWLLSVGTLIQPISAILSGFAIDGLGRLNALRLSTVPYAIGWMVTANANTVAALLIGKCLSSFSYGWFINGAAVYIAEISSPKIRGTLLNLKSVYISSGSLVALTIGSQLHWRTAAWINCGLSTVPLMLSTFLFESPLWFVTKGRISDARKSLHSFNRYKRDSEDIQKTVDSKLLSIQKFYEQQRLTKLNAFERLKFFITPAGYKRVFMVGGLQFFQDFSGISPIFPNIVQFIKDFGTTYNPYKVGMCIGIGKLVTAIFSIWLMKKSSRKTLMITSCAIMSGSMLTLGIYVDYSAVAAGLTNYQWIPLCAIALYVAAAIVGLRTVPQMVSAEIYPTQIRGTGQSVSSILGTVSEFSSIQCYYFLKTIVKASYLFYYIAIISLLGCVYIYVFVIETHRKTFAEIEKYFSIAKKKNTVTEQELHELNCK